MTETALNEAEPGKKKALLSHASAASVGAIVSGIVTGIVSHGESKVPLETFDWVLKNGVAALALLGCGVLGWAFWIERARANRLERVLTHTTERLQGDRLQDKVVCEKKLEAVYEKELVRATRNERLFTRLCDLLGGPPGDQP